MIMGKEYSRWQDLTHVVMCVPDIGMPMCKITKYCRPILPSHVWKLLQLHQALQDNLSADSAGVSMEVSSACFACGQSGKDNSGEGTILCPLCLLPSHMGFPC